ncbi:MAG: hypothetical protein IAB08_08995 [Bacteroidetes bacterium]|uniref:Uncharacterized protein n=1 Tax=Candidatus Pullibacteroides excrementavium TaxID=2840905 RepID=A0A9D9DUW3_9BACT|nr:hypothetical protein [Candidatus Pullibacteroides excrementavium]
MEKLLWMLGSGVVQVLLAACGGAVRFGDISAGLRILFIFVNLVLL